MRSFSLLALVALLATSRAAADVTMENAHLRLILASNACWKSVVEKAGGSELLPTGKSIPFASAEIAGRSVTANRATREGSRLTIGFGESGTELVYTVETAEEWITFRLTEIRGPRPARVVLVRVGVNIVDHVGPRLVAGWNDRLTVCLRNANLQTHPAGRRVGDSTELTASAQDSPGPKLEGSAASLLVGPTATMRATLAHYAEVHDLPRNSDQHGMASKDLPLTRQSYWFVSFAEKDVERVIDYCRRGGFRQVLLDSSSWCKSVGHYTIREDNYPDGLAGLRRTVDRLHAAGILVGMHTFASKVSKTDPYVTPVPDRHFWVARSVELADPITATAREVRTATDLREWPGSPVAVQKVWEGGLDKHREVVIDDEIIQYESIGPAGRWDTFLGCRRGAWGTQAAAHSRGAACRHYGVDGCINGYILDLDSALYGETTAQLARVFNECGFDMVYFDGSEDVDRRRFSYYSSKAHAGAMSKFTRRPLIHQGGGFTPELWHSFSRANTTDQYPGTYLAHIQAGGTLDKWPTCKEHIDRSVRGARACAEDWTPAELGWFGLNPKQGEYDGLQYDELEYLLCKSVALDAPISLQTGFRQLESHPLTPDLLELIRYYEAVRLAGQVPAEIRARLGAEGKDFVALRGALAGGDQPEFVEVASLSPVAGTNDLRAFVGNHARGAVATLWHYLGKEGQLLVDLPDLHAYDAQGRTVAVSREGLRAAIAVDARRLTLHFPGLSADAVRTALSAAEWRPRKPIVLWLQAEKPASLHGAMTTGAAAGLTDPKAMGDFVLGGGPIDRARPDADFVEYRVTVPRRGAWNLWARVRYPTGGDMSFGLALLRPDAPAEPPRVLGNCGQNDARWHWTGQGGGVSTVPPGAPIRLVLDAGDLVLRVSPREGPGRAVGNPRLDVLCLAEDPEYVPTDGDVRE